MQDLKGLILSGGKGTRLRPLTHTSAKQLVPVANKPVLFYGIEAMAAAGIREVGIVIAPETGGEIRSEAGNGERFGVSITYIEQAEPLGLAHAVLTAEPFLGDSPFVMYLGDNLLRDGITDLVEAFRAENPEALILLTPVPDPENYGVAELDGDNRVARLVEKPPDPQTNLALVGVYMFSPRIFEAARAIEPSARGELEITDAIQHLVDGSMRVDPHVVQGWWKDTGQVADMLEANRLILDDLPASVDGELLDTRIEGRVRVEAGARLERATVRGPAIIGAGSVVRDAYVGPVHGDRCRRPHRALRDRALDRAGGVQRRGPPGTHRGEPDRAQRARGAQSRAAARLPAGRRRQRRDRDPVKVLVTGALGMLGQEVVRAAVAAGHGAVGLNYRDLDVLDSEAVRRRLGSERPDAVVNCAAYTNVDGAETEREAALELQWARSRHGRGCGGRGRRRGRSPLVGLHLRWGQERALRGVGLTGAAIGLR